jgi:biotin carboxyl carrier protein
MRAKMAGKSVELPPDTGWRFTERPGGWLIAERTLPDGTIERTRVMAHQVGQKFWFHGRGSTYAGEWAPALRASANGSAAAPDTDLIAQFPGKVRKILVKAGQKVGIGDSLLLVEAMKMEFTIKAPSNGKVRAVLVQEAEQLLPGKLLIDFEAGESKVGGRSHK